MSSLSKRIIIYSCIAALTCGAAFVVTRQPVVRYASNVLTFVKEYSDAHDDVLQELRQEIFSQPIRRQAVAEDSPTLSPDQIIKLTNGQRSYEGLYPLIENKTLNKAAQIKLQDMFERQYFEHISPDGKGPGSLATKVGYSYVVIGENLALGTFKNEDDLIKAWMNSPGHRANILNKRYLQIGVAVGHGMFNGESVWLAVQEFGKPTSACPLVSVTLKTKIESDKAVIANTSESLTTTRARLEAMPHATASDDDAYNTKVAEYNDAVNAYNVLLTNLRTEIDEYNETIRAFNVCAQE